MRRFLCLLLCLAMTAALTAGCGPREPAEGADEPAAALSSERYQLRAAVLCASGREDEALASWLEQSTLLGLSVKTVAAEPGPNFSLNGYDAVYLSPSLLTEKREDLAQEIMDYVRRGGSVFLENGFHDLFPPDFFGAASFEKIEGCPLDALTFPAVGQDLRPLQELVEDFAALYPSFYGYEQLDRKSVV